MFDKILIANRGEIACRVARTARRMGIRTVAVYSDADADALHVAACDEAWRLGPAAPRESYLNGDAIIAIARKTGAPGVHPGYGFLSENAAFATACAAAGLVFVGPPPAAIAAMGSKAAAKRIMGDAGVPLVPGYHGDDQDPVRLANEAARIGFPVLIKATAGGGGKGMKIVESADAFAAALASAQREAKAAFGDERVLLEKYLSAPRHIEIQVFADGHGNAVTLFERDCSVQRRHQKVLEEAPAPAMEARHRRAMGEAALAAAKAIGYVGAGTVEFIAADSFARDGTFYFMEMNTRLQVEHPVTEMITGLDLVEWQLRVAAGEPLPRRQDELAIDGHAIEARIYAEDPGRGFLPSIGTLAHLRAPAAQAGVRVDTGVRAGDEISPYYDPMIAKLVVHGDDRAAALRRLAEALAGCEIVGVATNVAFLQRVVAHAAFASGRVDTGLIARHHDALFPAPAPTPADAILAAALAEVQGLVRARAAAAAAAGDPGSPWHAVDPWWPNSALHAIALSFADADLRHDVAVRRDGAGWRMLHEGRDVRALVRERDGRLVITADGAEFVATVVAHGEERHVFLAGAHWRLQRVDRLAHAGEDDSHGGHLMAPMSGTVVAVLVRAGDVVERGTPLLVLEAMKMEHTIVAPAPGTVVAVNYAAGERVREGADLVDIDGE
ncbi:MAG: acetyl-CoA carboxylase biotin carboxylase subunit [Betaproteobacteria bacterium]|nr:acetyl-CoA carboxylase biotin carboxylase subunit [Betaproteobacteria bacterium]